jgi:hypothetical protein
MAVLAGCKGRETRFQPWTRDIVAADWALPTEHKRSSKIAVPENMARKLFIINLL